MITIKYVDPITNVDVEQELDDSVINVPEYISDLHKNYLCKNICTGENCKVWLKTGSEYILMGVMD